MLVEGAAKWSIFSHPERDLPTPLFLLLGAFSHLGCGKEEMLSFRPFFVSSSAGSRDLVFVTSLKGIRAITLSCTYVYMTKNNNTGINYYHPYFIVAT